jgi:N-acetylglucosaminyldiphosphoundecaprenol N-acetyl-beta-D-mannosaminyltransferase
MRSFETTPYKVGLPAEALLPRANVLGVGVHAIDMDSALQLINQAVADGKRGYICLTGVHGVMEAQRDPLFSKVLAQASLVLPDGMPTVWMGRLQGFRGMRRVFGPDLMLAIMSHPHFATCSHFLYGGAPGVAPELRERLARRLPHVRIVGHYTPPFRRLNGDEELELAGMLQKLNPDIVWVGLSTPKQEYLMAEYLPRLSTTLMIGVGAAFDFHTGRLKDSPRWVKHSGLQWLHRLLQEPSRLWKRYASNNPKFLVNACLQLAGLRRYSLAASGTSRDDFAESTSIRATCK